MSLKHQAQTILRPEKASQGLAFQGPWQGLHPVNLESYTHFSLPAGFLTSSQACPGLGTSVTPSLSISHPSEPVPPNLTLFHKPPQVSLGPMGGL